MAFVPTPRSVEVVQAGPDRLAVSGSLTFQTARRAYEAGCSLLAAAGGGSAAGPVQIDCAGVTESDSAGLAVLIEWLAAATRLGRHVHYQNLPEGIRATAQISDVTSLLESGT